MQALMTPIDNWDLFLGWPLYLIVYPYQNPHSVGGCVIVSMIVISHAMKIFTYPQPFHFRAVQVISNKFHIAKY